MILAARETADPQEVRRYKGKFRQHNLCVGDTAAMLITFEGPRASLVSSDWPSLQQVRGTALDNGL